MQGNPRPAHTVKRIYRVVTLFGFCPDRQVRMLHDGCQPAFERANNRGLNPIIHVLPFMAEEIERIQHRRRQCAYRILFNLLNHGFPEAGLTGRLANDIERPVTLTGQGFAKPRRIIEQDSGTIRPETISALLAQDCADGGGNRRRIKPTYQREAMFGGFHHDHIRQIGQLMRQRAFAVHDDQADGFLLGNLQGQRTDNARSLARSRTAQHQKMLLQIAEA